MNIDFTDVCSNYFDRNQRIIGGYYLAASANHRRRVIDCMDVAAWFGNVVPHRERSGTQRAAEIKTMRLRLDISLSERTDGEDRCFITRNRSFYHVRKNIGDSIIELKNSVASILRCENLILVHICISCRRIGIVIALGPSRTGWGERHPVILKIQAQYSL